MPASALQFPGEAVERVFREESGRILAGLIRVFGDLTDNEQARRHLARRLREIEEG